MSKTFIVNNFDAFEYANEIPNTDLRARVLRSLAWRVDTLLQGAARQIFKNSRDVFMSDHDNNHIDARAEYLLAVEEQAFAEQSFYQAGSENTGPVATIKDLWLFRDELHEQAATVTSMTCDYLGRPGRYEIPDIDEVLMDKVELKARPETKRRIAHSVNRRASAYGLDKDEVEQHIKVRLQREQDRLDSIAVTVQTQTRAVSIMFHLALTAASDQYTAARHFHELDVAAQRSLIESIKQTADRFEMDATSNRNMTDAEFDDVCMSVMKVHKDCDAALRAPRFVNAAAKADAAERNVG